MSTIVTHLLGRHREHDPASWLFEHPVKTLLHKRTVIHNLAMPHLDQGDVGSCEGNTAAEWLGTDAAVNNRKAYWAKQKGTDPAAYPTEKDALALYSEATVVDSIPGQYPPNDTGTSGLGIAKAMVASGGIARYNWTFTAEAFYATLQQQPIMLGTNWYDAMMECDSNGFVVEPKASDTPNGGHAYLAYVLDWTNQRVGCTNHWSENGTVWGTTIGGHDGSFWIRFALLERLLIAEQGDSLVPVLM